MSGEELAQMTNGAFLIICNDYELEILRQKTGLDESDLLARATMLVVTRGEHGSSIIRPNARVDVPAVPPRHIVDPTGVGDAYRAGLMKGLAHGADDAVCAQLGSVAATYALEHLGGQSHAYTAGEFRQRYEQHFGKLDLQVQGGP
jgi:adenosine kinase